MTTYRVYFEDGNIKIFEAYDIFTVISYVLFELNYDSYDIKKIEKVVDE